jgi:DnaK suppressor protein
LNLALREANVDWAASIQRIGAEHRGKQSDRMDCDRLSLVPDKIGGQIVKTEEYKQILLVKEREMLQQMEREGTDARESSDEEVHSWGDQSATDAGSAEEFGVAGIDLTTLRQVQDALKRIEAGTFGKCIVDHRPISEKRLKGVPWASYCLKHQQELELKASIKTPTL